MKKKRPFKKARKKKKRTSSVRSRDLLERLSDFSRNQYLPLLIVTTFVGFLLVVGFWFHRIGHMHAVEGWDFYADYVEQARSFQRGRVMIDAFRGPVYPIVLGIFEWIIGDFFRAGVSISVLSAGALLLLTFALLRRLYNRGLALLVLLLIIGMGSTTSPTTSRLFSS